MAGMLPKGLLTGRAVEQYVRDAINGWRGGNDPDDAVHRVIFSIVSQQCRVKSRQRMRTP